MIKDKDFDNNLKKEIKMNLLGNKHWCDKTDCKNFFPSKCEFVMTDYHLKQLKSGNYTVAYLKNQKCYIKK